MQLKTKTVVTLLLTPMLFYLVLNPAPETLGKYSGTSKLDQITSAYLQDTLKKTTLSFAAARGVNAMVSVAQSLEVGGSLVISGSFQPGQVLDPLNDMVERFSWVMLISSISIGFQMFLVQVLPWMCIQFLLPAGIVMLLAGIWVSKLRGLLVYGGKLIILLLVLRFLMPVMALTNQKVYNYTLKERYENASEYITADSKSYNNDTSREKSDVMYDVKKLHEKIEAIKRKASDYFEYLTDLIIVFTVQTMLMPLITLWIFLMVLKNIIRMDFSFEKIFTGWYRRI